MRKRVVILGGGVGGTIVANRLAKKVRAPDADITVIDSTGKHVYQPGFVYTAFDNQGAERLVRNERKLLKRKVKLLIGEASRIDHENNRVVMGDGREVPYDYLVIATGSTLSLEDVPGAVGSTYHFYSSEEAQRLRKALEEFHGGRVVIAIGGVPYKCPPAPAEAACQLDYFFHRKGIRDKVDIHYLSPLTRVFPLETVNPLVERVFREKGVKSTIMFNVESVDPREKVIRSLEGEVVPYDLLILIPPHKGAKVVRGSGLGDRGGWIPTDKHTLRVKGHENIWAIGDATDIPISKAGATAHYEAQVVADNIAHEITGKGTERMYDGKVMCFCDAGFKKGISMSFDYEHPPIPPPLSRRHYWGKVLVNSLYWHLVPKARV